MVTLLKSSISRLKQVDEKEKSVNFSCQLSGPQVYNHLTKCITITLSDLEIYNLEKRKYFRFLWFCLPLTQDWLDTLRVASNNLVLQFPFSVYKPKHYKENSNFGYECQKKLISAVVFHKTTVRVHDNS